MQRDVVLVLAAAFLATTPARAQAPAADLSPLEFLVGNCWVGTFPDGKTTDEHCFEWKYGRHFVRDHHVVRGADGARAYEGETIYGWNPTTKEIVWRYISVDGLIMDGTLTREGDTLIFPARYPTPKGMVEIKAVWTRLANGYRAVNSQKAGNDWKEQFSVEFRRKD